MDWLTELSADKRLVVLAVNSHNTIDFDFDLTSNQSKIADAMYEDLLRSIDHKVVSGYAAKIPEEDRHMIWAMTAAYHKNLHAPVDNLPGQAWDRAEEIHEVLNAWGSPRP